MPVSILIRQQSEQGGAYRGPVSIVRWLGSAVSIALRAIAGAFVAALLAAILLGVAGFHMITVTGGSMGNALPIASVAVTRTIGAQQVEVGDIVAFRDSSASAMVLHRVVAINSVGGERQAVTRGDHNSSPDPTPLVLQGRGDRVVYSVPLLGYLFVFATSPLGLLTLLTSAAALLLWPVMTRRQRRRPPGFASGDGSA